MARGRPKGSKNRVAAPKPPPSAKPVSRAALATLEQVQDQDRERATRGWKSLGRELGAHIQVSDKALETLHEAHNEAVRRNAESFKDCFARITSLESRIDSANARATEAIARCNQAAEVLRRVELGLRPMLLKALEAEQEARSSLYSTAYDEAYNLYLHTSSLRS
jgi:hypothetical protein